MKLKYKTALILFPLIIIIAYQIYSYSDFIKDINNVRETIVIPATEESLLSANIQFLSAQQYNLIQKAVMAMYTENKERMREAIQQNILVRGQRQAGLQELQEISKEFLLPEDKFSAQLKKDVEDLVTNVDTVSEEITSEIAASSGTHEETIRITKKMDDELVPICKELFIALTVVSEHSTNKVAETTRIVDQIGKRGLQKSYYISAVLLIIVVTIVLFLNFAILKPINEVRRGTEIIGTRNLGHRIQVTSKDEIGGLASAFNDMVERLQTATATTESQNWTNTGRAKLDDRMRGDQSIDELCNNIITFIANYLKVQVGTLYVNDGEGLFKLKASYAYKTLKKLPSDFKTGEGLIGQAALEKQSKVLSNVPEDYITVISGLGEKKPRNILVAPFIYNETVRGVLEVGSFDEFTDVQITFLEQISERIAIAINSAQSRVELGKTVEKRQRQAEEMESQQEELKAANEELEEQTQRLQASEEQLKTQQEELQALNEELEEKARAFEERNKSET